MRFYDPNSGAIYINGKNIKEYDEGLLREMFGTVSQQDTLFSNTILYNVDFNRDLPEENIMKAIKASQAYNFVFNEKEGLDTMLNARGTNLSGGQKQRLLIARALANNPEILVLDDSSSALDYKTDSMVRKAIIEEYHPTLFIISQRISSIMNLDQIIVMDNGKAVAIGRHEELLETCKIYQDIHKLEVGNNGIANA
jgi:ATP-binding cassette subfamily B protein